MTARRGTLAIVAACLFAGTVTINGERTHRLPAPPAAPAFPALPTSLLAAPVAHTLGRQPLSFEANRGQADPRVQFIARGAGYSIGLSPTAADLSLQPTSNTGSATTVRMTLAGARGTSRVTGVGELPGKINYFLGNDSTKWVTNVPTFARVEYTDVYPGVNLVYYGNQRELEYDFIVAPGADPKRIALAFDGAEGIELDGNRDLRLHVPGGAGDIRLHTPVVYQEIDGRRVSVESAFRIAKDAPSRIGIDVGDYDETRALVIDPILSYSTYLGSDFADYATAVAADAAGNAYVTGYTRPGNGPFPVTAGAFQTSLQGECCVAFVTKFSPTGGIVYSTYLGGAGAQYGSTGGAGIAVDSDGNAYITGFTGSGLFPTVHPIQAGCSGFSAGAACSYLDAFVTKLNATGSALIYSTFVGGYGNDYGYGIAVDPAGNAYIVGQTWTSDFPSVNALQAFNGGADAFVVKVNPAGSAFVYATPLGGGAEYGWAIAADASGNAYVTGQTYAGVVFPTTSGAVQVATGGGTWDAFVTKINPTGSARVYSTYLGGTGDDYGHGIAVDVDGHAYVAGTTCSANFPTANPLQAANHSSCNAFISKLNVDGSALVYSTYLGGAGGEGATGIAVDGAGNAFVAGYGGGDLPLVDPVQATWTGGFEGFVAKLNAAGSALEYSTYFGGSANDYIYGIAIDSAGSAYIAGLTYSRDLPTVNAIQPTNNAWGGTAFVAKIESPGADVAITKTGSASPVIVGQTLTYTITASNHGPVDATGVTVTDTLPAGVTFVSAVPSAGSCGGTSTITCNVGALANGNTATITIAVTPSSAGSVTNTASISANQFDAVSSNNTASAATTVTKGDVTITLVSSANPSTFNQPVTFTATVSGVAPAPGMPTGMVTFEEGATTLGAAAVDGSGHATIATSSLAVGSHEIVAAYSGDDAFNPNNSAALAQTVTALVDLSITKTAAPNPVTAGQPLTYTMTVGNAGPSASTGVTLTDTLPAGVAFVSSTASQGSCSGTATVTCAIGSLASGASAAVTIVVTPPAAGTISNAASVAANEPDANMANNSASVQTTVSAMVQTATIADLLSKVNGLGLNGGLKNSLSVKLQAAQQSLSKGNRGAAINQLSAFINQVRALKQSGQLNASTADPLIAEAQAIIAEI